MDRQECLSYLFRGCGSPGLVYRGTGPGAVVIERGQTEFGHDVFKGYVRV